jgi:hypothetical protein
VNTDVRVYSAVEEDHQRGRGGGLFFSEWNSPSDNRCYEINANPHSNWDEDDDEEGCQSYIRKEFPINCRIILIIQGGDMMTKGKDAKKDPKKKPAPSSATSQGNTITMLNQQPSKKKKEYK